MQSLSSVRIQDSIAEQACLHPHHLAVEAGQDYIDYAELHARSGVIASHLVAVGAGPEILVGVLIDRSVELVTAIVSILRSGSAYMPIDVETPEERLRFMIEDSGPSLLVTQKRYRRLVADLGPQTRILYIEDFPADNIGADVEMGLKESLCNSDSDSLAYVIYTSGSTGRPKGVEVTHGGLGRFCAHMQQELKFTAEDTMLAIASASFDVAVFELLFPLYCGGRVVILQRIAAADGRELGAAIEHYKPSVVLATPATWKVLTESDWKGHRSLRAVSGGEAMPPSLARVLLQRIGELWNHYGPTEATIATTTYRVRGDEEKIPIGHPIAGLRLLVLDADRNPVPRGNAGELYITGPGVARGYRRDQVRTSQRFVSVPDTPDGVRAYRTGDLVRYTESGDLEFVGRADNQVKIRGHRVELEEIEAALVRHPDVTEAAVIVQDRDVDDKRLIAFVVTGHGSKQNAADIRRFLAPILHSFMIPGKFFFPGILPKNANGKIDRHALQIIASLEPEVHSGPVVFADPTVRKMLEVWRHIPGFENIGADDSFFDYGGHSLLAVKLMKEVSACFGVTLPLAVLFEAQTVRALACIVREGVPLKSWSPMVPIRVTGPEPPLFCIHGIGGNVLNFKRLGKWLSSDHPLYGLQAFGVDHGRSLSSVEEMAGAYLRYIREVQPTGPYLISGYSAGGIVAFEIARQLRQADQQVALLILFDALMYTRASVDNRKPPFTGYLRKAGKIATRIALFARMRGRERWESLRRNWTYYLWLLGITLRTRAFLILKKAGLRLPPPAGMQDAFALAIHEYHPPTGFDGHAVLFRAANGDSSEDVKPTMGWENLVGELTVEVCEADHLGMFYEPQVKTLAHSLNRHLRFALGREAADVAGPAPDCSAV